MIGSRRTARSWYDYHVISSCTDVNVDMEETNLCTRIPVVVGVKVVFGHLLWIF